MAIQWGAWQNHVRIGIDLSQNPASVGSGTSSVSLNLDVYAQTDGSTSIYNSASVSFSGFWTGGWGLQLSLGPGQTQLIHRVTLTESTASSARALWYGVTLAHMFGSSYGRRDHTIPARPAAPPSTPGTPSGLSVSRSSDTQHTLSWSNSGAAATSVTIQRRENNGSWVQIAKPSGNPSSYVDKTTKANRKYDYRVRRSNSGGTSAWSGTATVYTTPAPPTGVSASRSGGNIKVTASGTPPYATSYDVMDGTTQVATGVALPWTHSSPSASVPHTYKVRAKRGSLASAWSAVSNTVQLTAPPNAPLNLSSRSFRLLGQWRTELSWQHNPVDASDQTWREIEYRINGGSWITAVRTDSSDTTYSFATSTAGMYEWRVRTRGEHPDWSPYSAVASFEIIDVPMVSIVAPDTIYDQAQLTVEWSWYQEADRPQSAWEVTLTEVETEVEVAARSGSGAATTTTLPYRLTDDTTYKVAVRAATGTIWSDWDELVFTVAFVPPAEPVIDGGWQEDSGMVSLSCTQGSGDPLTPATVSLEVQRSVDEGTTWETVIESEDVEDLVFEDWESLSNGATLYRAISYATTGASAITEITVLSASPAMWLSGGDGFGLAARLPYDPTVSISTGRSRSVQRYEGRSQPVAYAGEQISRTVSASGRILEREEANAAISVMEDIAQAEAPLHLYRDPDGRRIYGSLSTMSLPRQTGTPDGAIWGWSVELEETDR